MIRRERKYAVGGAVQTYDFLWDGDDRLRQVKQGVSSRFSATYNGDGLRASKTDLFSATAHYTWGPGGVLSDGATTYTPGLGQRQGTSASRFSHSDWVGSTRYLSDPSGLVMPSAMRYDAYGQRTALARPTYPTPYQFAGGWGYETEYSDATEPYLGLDYVEQRYYEPATGRFVSPDPIGFDGWLNLFAYCDNDPINAVDPEGTCLKKTDPGCLDSPYGPLQICELPYGVAGGWLEDALLEWPAFAQLASRLPKIRWPWKAPGPLLKMRPGSIRLRALGRAVWKGHAVADDWAVKGAHATVNGVELAVRPGAGGRIVFKPVFSGDAARAGQAIQAAQELLKDPKFVADLLGKVRQAKSYVLHLPKAGGVGRSAELHFLEGILERLLAGR